MISFRNFVPRACKLRHNWGISPGVIFTVRRTVNIDIYEYIMIPTIERSSIIKYGKTSRSRLCPRDAKKCLVGRMWPAGRSLPTSDLILKFLQDLQLIG